MADTVRQPSPWVAEDLLRAGGTILVGLAASVTACYLAGGEDALAEQVRWANLSVAGFVVGSYGMVGWLLRGRRAVGQRRIALLGDARRSVVVGPVASWALEGSTVFVAGEGRDRYHRAECPFAAGRGWATASPAEHEAAGRRPCQVCVR